MYIRISVTFSFLEDYYVALKVSLIKTFEVVCYSANINEFCSDIYIYMGLYSVANSEQLERRISEIIRSVICGFYLLKFVSCMIYVDRNHLEFSPHLIYGSGYPKKLLIFSLLWCGLKVTICH